MNRKFAKSTDSGIRFAEDYVDLDGFRITNPRAIDYRRAGYFSVVDERPQEPAPTGKHWLPGDYAFDDSAKVFRRVYTAVDDPAPAPRVFSKLKLELACFKAGLLPALDTFVDAQSITNERGDTMPLRRAYETALEFSEDNPYFSGFKAAAIEALGITDAAAEEILAQCVADA